MSKVRLFIITDEGEYNELPFQNKDQLDSEEVYLIVDESGKNIWIYKGGNARIRKKFLGARAATELRQDIGFRARDCYGRIGYQETPASSLVVSTRFAACIGLKPRCRCCYAAQPRTYRRSNQRRRS